MPRSPQAENADPIGNRRTTTTASRDDLLGRAGTYRLLSRVWQLEVDAGLLSQLRTEPLRSLFTDAAGIVPQPADGSPLASNTRDAADSPALVLEAGLLDELATEFCSLFIGPACHAPPIQSVWESGQLEGKPAQSMRAFMELIQFQPQLSRPQLVADHLGLQLEFMSHLLQHQILQQATPQVHTFEEVTSQFFLSHLQWAEPMFCAGLQHATSDFYRSTIALTQQFLASEATP